MAGISIEVTNHGNSRSYLPVGVTMRAIDAETGQPLDLTVAVDRGMLLALPPEPPAQPSPAVSCAGDSPG